MDEKEKYILYLQLSKSLDSGFIRLAAEFKEYGVHLIPVQVNELDHFLTRSKVPVIVLTNSLRTWNSFLKIRKSGLEFYLKGGKIKLFHLHSFKEILEYRAYSQKGNYRLIPLPIKFEKAVFTVLADYEQGVGKDNAWPGGKRAKLPRMSNE